MSRTTKSESSESDQSFGEEEQDEKLDFQGTVKKLGLAISVTAVGGAVVYAFGLVVIIAILVAILLALGLYLRYR